MGAHARLSASAAHRWMACPGSVRLSAPLPNVPTEPAAEGTFAHTIAAECLRDDGPREWLGIKRQVEGFEITCDKEMVDGVEFYLDVLREDYEKGDKCLIEVDLTPALSKIDSDTGGTADYVRWRPKAKQLRVFDFKYGAGKLVHAVNNEQLRMYALGALLTLNQPVNEVVVTIVQPRIEHEDGRVRDWKFPAVELLNFAADVADAAIRTRESNAPLVPGAEQCQFCPARRVCPELEKEQHALVAQKFGATQTYDPKELTSALNSIPLVEARIKAIREFAYAEAERGNPPPGYKLVAKRGIRKWIDEKEVVAWAKSHAIEAYEEPSLKSPAQLEKGLGKAEKEDLALFVVSVSSGHTLAEESDKRPAVHKALAGEFAVIPGTAGQNEVTPPV